VLEFVAFFQQAVVHGAAGIAKPALISTLSICCAFVSVTFLTDAPKYLFIPQALAVVFGMLASYVLSRTLVPIMIDVLVKNERHGHDPYATPTNVSGHIRAGFERGFTKFHKAYIGLLCRVIVHRGITLGVAGSIIACAAVLFMFVGTDYFPQIG
jgi:multidrug efflux pump subunit AcrB